MTKPIAVIAANAPPRTRPLAYPKVFHAQVGVRTKRPLGDLFGLANFGVNLTTLEPGSRSALQHRHSAQDEFIYILEGQAVLVTGAIETVLTPGMCAGFPAGGESHHLENRSGAPVHYLEIGDRSQGDDIHYPHDDLVASMKDGERIFHRKNGEPF
ncbi:MAG: cupin domain-containing protein [Beijerinckiaceae bacterium]|nr:cupin domain-containing protein [Beijerinckiaceae bacterium]